MSLRIDFSRFKMVARDIARERKKDEAEVVNKGLVTAIIGSNKYKGIVQLAPKATRAQIEADMRHEKRNIKMTTAQLRNQGYFAAKRTRFEIQQKIKEVSRARLKKRIKSRGYLAAGWLRPLHDLGFQRTKGRKETNYWSGGTAAQGYGIKARPSTLVAKAFSMARGSGEVLPDVMQMAVDNAAQDMADYFINKVGKTLQRLTG